MTNPDAEPKLTALFAEPMREVKDDERALQSVLAHLEGTDRRRGFILALAGALGAGLAVGIIALTNGVSSSFAGLSTLSMRVMSALAQVTPEWRLPTWTQGIPDGGIALGVSALALCVAAGFVLRTRS